MSPWLLFALWLAACIGLGVWHLRYTDVLPQVRSALWWVLGGWALVLAGYALGAPRDPRGPYRPGGPDTSRKPTAAEEALRARLAAIDAEKDAAKRHDEARKKWRGE